MVQYCCAYGCNSRHVKLANTNPAVEPSESEYPLNKLSFHRFPLKKPELLKKWIVAVRRENFLPTPISVLCSLHFEKSAFEQPIVKLKRLKQDAVPTIFTFGNVPKRRKSPKKRKTPEKKKKPDDLTTRSFSSFSCHTLNSSDLSLAESDATDSSLGEFLCDSSSDKHSNSTTDTSSRPPSSQSTGSTRGRKAFSGEQLRRKLRAAQQSLRRRNKKIEIMEELIDNLQENGLDADGINAVNIMRHEAADIFQHEKRNAKVHKNNRYYSDGIQKFALTVYYYSPKAYKYLRSIFTLPDTSTIRRWSTSVNCEPGFLTEVFEQLKVDVIKKPWLKDCSVIIDVMSIRNRLMWDQSQSKYSGYVVFGNLDLGSPEEPATEALFFMLVSMTQFYKAPLGYFLTNKCSRVVQTQLINICIEKFFEIGIKPCSITFDGAATNVTTARQLGCDINSTRNETRSTFTYKSETNNGKYVIAICFDPCHMNKLARNALDELGWFESDSGLIISSYLILRLKTYGVILTSKYTKLSLRNKLTKLITFKNM